MKHTLTLLTALLLAPLAALYAADQPAQPTRPDIVLADFEQGYGDWIVKGEAFNHPTTTIVGNVNGFKGKGLADSWDKEHQVLAGTLASPQFTIERNFIRFLVCGRGFNAQASLQLLIDGKLEFYACGTDDRELRPGAFDVSSFQGRKAQLVVSDAGEWVSVSVDEIVASDSAAQQARVFHPISQCIPVNKQMDLKGMRYLTLPINNLAPMVKCVLEVDGVRRQDVSMRLAIDAPVDFWAFYPLEGGLFGQELKGQKIRFTSQEPVIFNQHAEGFLKQINLSAQPRDDAGKWASVSVNEIVASDSAAQQARVFHPISQWIPVNKQMNLKGMRYLILPINNLAPKVNCVVEVDGERRQELIMRLAIDSPVDFWASYPLDRLNVKAGQKLRFYSSVPAVFKEKTDGFLKQVNLSSNLFVPLGALHAAEAAKPIPLKRSPITNCWGDVKPVKIPVEHVTIFRGREGEGYSHVQQLTSLNGKLYATWSLGLRDEEAPGQRMVMSVSEDHGRTWSAPTTIAPSRHGKAFQSNVSSCGMRILPDGRFVAYSAEWEWEADAYNPDGSRRDHPWGQRPPQWNPLESRTEARVSTDGGRSWGEPVIVAPNQAGYHNPFQTRSGRLILPGNYGVCHYTDDPAGLTGWKRASIPGLPSNHSDNYFQMYQARASLGIAELFSEACVYQTDNGVLHMMMRQENGPMLGVTESRDDGLTWSTPMLTSFTDNVCRANFGRLPDGRFYALSCPAPSPNEFAGTDAVKVRRTNLEYSAGPGQFHLGRTPLVLSLSRDGITFDRHFILGDQPVEVTRIPGKGKGGRYGYPFLHVMGDEVFAIYSRNKDDIAVGRFKLADIAP